MTLTLTKVRAFRPDILVVSGHEKGVALSVRQGAEMRLDAPMLALTHCDSAQIIEKFGKRSAYAVCGSQWDRSLSDIGAYESIGSVGRPPFFWPESGSMSVRCSSSRCLSVSRDRSFSLTPARSLSAFSLR
ncbi:type 1 periplasmic-binding domain-containing protein [Paraburkholderia dilworthii]|uniref:hypothetical protein n=1 Tax=Paraburkholderia dilworthii TaxID=948106 RepID=UPI001FCBAC58|nr:hypothetical protein [Paraburkholderia dilworthii]